MPPNRFTAAAISYWYLNGEKEGFGAPHAPPQYCFMEGTWGGRDSVWAGRG